MKNLTKGILIGIAISAIVGFTATEYTVNKRTAEVEVIEGLHVFSNSKPVTPYDYITTVKPGVTVNGYHSQVVNSIIRKVKKDYPTADGIIITSNSSAEVIKFK